MKSRQIWLQRQLLRLSVVFLIAPVWLLYQSMNPVFPDPWPEQSIGPFTAIPTPADDDAPYYYDGEYYKDFSVRLCEGCTAQLRRAFLSIGTEASIPEDEPTGILHGSGFILHAHAPAPEHITEEDRLWLMIEDWQGKHYTQSWELPAGVITTGY